MAVSQGQLAVIKLSVDELEKGGALSWAMGEPLVKRLPHGLRASPFLFVGDYETSIYREEWYRQRNSASWTFSLSF